MLEVGLSPSKNVGFIWCNENPLNMIKVFVISC